MRLYSYRILSSSNETLVSSYVHPDRYRIMRKAAAAAATLSGALLIEQQAVGVNRLGKYRVTVKHWYIPAQGTPAPSDPVLRMHDELMTLDSQYDPEWMPPFSAMLSGIFSRAYKAAYTIPDIFQLVDTLRAIEDARYCYNHSEEV
jgi:hypothetical protein